MSAGSGVVETTGVDGVVLDAGVLMSPIMVPRNVVRRVHCRQATELTVEIGKRRHGRYHYILVINSILTIPLVSILIKNTNPVTLKSIKVNLRTTS